MKLNEENLEGAAGGYILDPGRLYPYKVIDDTTGATLGSKLRHDEAGELAKTLGVSIRANGDGSVLYESC